MTRRWNPYYRSTNGHLAKTNSQVGKLLYVLVFLVLFSIGNKIWGIQVGLIMGIIGDAAYALVGLGLRAIDFWDH